MASKKKVKTNAMRILDTHKIDYEVLTYECDEFVDALQVAELTNTPHEQSFKTLILQGKSQDFYVFVVPIEGHIDLKQASKLAGEKNMALIPTKDCLSVSGYARGTVSPIGMKKQYKTFIHESAKQYEAVYLSGGKKGITLKVNPHEVSELLKAPFGEFLALD